MTQMLLFDAPVGIADATLVPVAESVGFPGSGSVSADRQTGSEAKSVADQLQCDSGLHHMGDLARLVLLRYDLMAKRRAQLAARRQAK